MRTARDRADRVVLVGENDHYKPLAVCLRQLLRDGVIGEMVFAHFMTLARKLKTADDWRNDETMAGGDAFFEEGIHWLHLAGSLGPRIVDIHGFRPSVSRTGTDRRAKSMMVAFRYDNDAVGSLYYSREIPSLLRGLRLSKLLGRDGIISFESNGLFIIVRGGGLPRLVVPGFRDMRGYQAMYRDFVRAIRAATGAGDEPRAGDGRPAPDGTGVRERAIDGRGAGAVMRRERYDVVVIGSGAGGGTLAYALSKTHGPRPDRRARRLHPPGRTELGSARRSGSTCATRHESCGSTPTDASSRRTATTTSAATASSGAACSTGCGARISRT